MASKETVYACAYDFVFAVWRLSEKVRWTIGDVGRIFLDGFYVFSQTRQPLRNTSQFPTWFNNKLSYLQYTSNSN